MNNPKILFENQLYHQIVQEFGTPTYVYSEELIRSKCQTLVNLFKGWPLSVLYAIKANDNPHLLTIINSEGLGYDTVSSEEVELALTIGAKGEDIFYTENNMTDEEMHLAVDKGVFLNIGSMDRFRAFCRDYPGHSCSIRLKPDIGAGHHSRVTTGGKESKFGIQLDLVPALLDLAGQSNVKVEGLHIHIGSGISQPESLIDAVQRLLQVSRQFPDVRRLNFGGGIPIPYRSSDEVFSMEHFSDLLKPIMQKELKERPELRFFMEPGRWVIAEAGALLTRVMSVKQQGETTFVGTDTGFNHLMRPAMYNSFHEIVNLSSHDGAEMEYTVSGNICESGDIIAEKRRLTATQTGDLLHICDAGAYGMTMASEYNRRRLPAEVLVRTDGSYQLIRRRRTPQESIHRFLEDTLFR